MEPKSSETTQSSAQPMGPAVVLTGIGAILMLAALFSNQWLEIVNWSESYNWRDAHLGPIGLFTDVSSHGAGFRLPIAALLLLTPLWLFVGMFRRWALYAALACAFSGAVVASAWVFSQTDMGAGRAYTLAMIGLATIAAGVTQALMVPIMRTGRNARGEFVDGRKHGRWHVYDARGTCVVIEEWEHGELVKSSRVESA